MDSKNHYSTKRGFRGCYSRVFLSIEGAESKAEKELSKTVQDLLDEYFYTLSSDKKRCFSFSIYVERDIDYYKQSDSFSMHGLRSTSSLDCHIDYNIFVNANQNDRIKLLSTACVLLLQFWIENYSLPKDVDLNNIISGLSNHLNAQGSLLSSSSFWIKPNENVFFRFMTTLGMQTNLGNISYDLDKMGKYLTNNLVHNNYGLGIKRFDFGYQLSKYGFLDSSYFSGSEKYYTYSKKSQRMIVASNFNYDIEVTLSAHEQWDSLTGSIIDALEFCQHHKRAPKSFDFDRFKKDVILLLSEYNKSLL